MLEAYLQVRSFAATFSTQIYQTRAVSTSGRHFLFNEDCDRSKDPEKYRLSQKKGDLKRCDHKIREFQLTCCRIGTKPFKFGGKMAEKMNLKLAAPM